MIMALVPVDQTNMGLTGGGAAAACGAASAVSVLRYYGPLAHTANQIFRRTSTTRITRYLGSTPGNIADYLISQGRTVFRHIDLHDISPLTATLALGLRMSAATPVAALPAGVAGGPPFFIHFLKIHGVNPAGHFVVSDGLGSYMDPGNGGVIGAFPNWVNFYDAGLTLVVQ
jgi:hypothetical protein